MRTFKVRPQRQRGSVLVNVAAGIGAMVVLLGLIDLGFLYYYQREYQKAADLAALAGSQELRIDCAAAQLSGNDSASANLSSSTFDTSTIQCGTWKPNTTPRFIAAATEEEEEDANAVRALVFGSVPTIFRGNRSISASAVSLALEPIAQLTIRSSVASLDTEDSAILDSVVGGLLGGSVALSPASYNGLLNSDINLLSFLDALAVETGVGAGEYDQVLNTDIALGDLLDVAADVLNQGGGSGDSGVAAAAIGSLVSTGLPGLDPLIRLGDLISVAAGTQASGLDTNLNVFQLVQGGVQLANGDSVATANLPLVGVPGVATATAKIKVIEPPQLSAIGNPATDDLSVRTAQARTLITINLSGVSNLVNGLTTAVAPFLNPIVNFLNTAGSSFTSLNLLGAVGNLLTDVFALLLTVCNNNCPVQNATYVEGLGQPLQISLDAAGANASVTDFNCAGNKSLAVDADTSVAHLRIGSMDEADVFSNANPVVNPVALVEIGYRRTRARQCTLILGIGGCSDVQWEQNNGSFLTNGMATAKRYVISGLGIKVDSAIAGSSTFELDYLSPDLPDVGEEPEYQDISSTGVVNSLASTLADVEIMPYSSSAAGVLGSTLTGTLSLLNGVVDTVQGVVDGVLDAILDPVIDSLLENLGLNLADSDVGANLSCEGGGGALVE